MTNEEKIEQVEETLDGYAELIAKVRQAWDTVLFFGGTGCSERRTFKQAEAVLGKARVDALGAETRGIRKARRTRLRGRTMTSLGLIFAHLTPALEDARNLDRVELPRLMADLEEVRCTALARLSAPAPATAAPDELLTVKQAAQKLGCSVDYLYKKNFPFLVRLGRKRMFSRAGIERFLQAQK